MRALVIEDDEVTAGHIAATLASEGIAAERRTDGAEGLSAALSGGYDIVIVDRMLPSLNGIDIIGKLRAVEMAAPILVLSALGSAQDRVAGLDVGADDYLAKPFDASELAARVRALLRRAKGVVSPDVLMFGDLEIRPRARTVHRKGKHIALSPKEFELLMFFAENAGRIVTRNLLHEKVWKLRFDPQTNVADVHVGRLRRKLEGNDPATIIATVRGEGYIFMPGA
jgi:two-component system OmpR family response regulator